MSKKFKGFLNNLLSGALNPGGTMKDWHHARALYTNDDHRLAPKQKFLYHVHFDIDNTIPARRFTTNEKLELNMLVKSADLPRFNLNIEEKQQYNKKT